MQESYRDQNPYQSPNAAVQAEDQAANPQLVSRSTWGPPLLWLLNSVLIGWLIGFLIFLAWTFDS